jgi:hypothetical protein
MSEVIGYVIFEASISPRFSFGEAGGGGDITQPPDIPVKTFDKGLQYGAGTFDKGITTEATFR